MNETLWVIQRWFQSCWFDFFSACCVSISLCCILGANAKLANARLASCNSGTLGHIAQHERPSIPAFEEYDYYNILR